MKPQHTLFIDLETYCDAPIQKTGAWRYQDDDSFEILLLAYSLDGGPVLQIDLAQGEDVPRWFIEALTSPEYIKHAYNAAFEFGCFDRAYGGMVPEQWRCTMVKGLYCGYPGSLDAAGAAIGIPQDKRKMTVGKSLIRFFCCPCKPTKANGGRTRNLPRHDPDKWELFKTYNRQDVEAEMSIDRMLNRFEMPESVWQQFFTDLKINRRGVYVDLDFTDGALDVGRAETERLTAEAQMLSGLSNPNSVAQLKDWLEKELPENVEISSLNKETVSDILRLGVAGETATRMLEIRQALGKTSTKKYDAIEACACKDHRVRGLLQFYGANRTGRYAGRLVQVQNLPRTYIEPLPLARKLVKARRGDILAATYGPVQDVLSQLIRTNFTATPGNVLIDADFSAIEARVIAWMAGESWKLEAFRRGEDIYCSTASRMFGVPVVKHGVNGDLRQRGKVAELACGYGGSVGAIRRMDIGHALDENTDDEVKEIVNQWRAANPRIVELWGAVETAAMKVVTDGGKAWASCFEFCREWSTDGRTPIMTVKIPSGRKLFYPGVHVTTNRFGSPSIAYMGVDQNTKKWSTVETYGGKLVENLTQAVARDCLAEAIERLEAAGLPVVFHVHDEVVIDCPRFSTDDEMLGTVTSIMSQQPAWGRGIPLNAEGWVGEYFKKD